MRSLASFSVLIFAATVGCSGGDDAQTVTDASTADASSRDATSIVDAGTDAALGASVAYASGYGPDLSIFTVDPTTGVLTPKSTMDAGDPSPSFLAIRPGSKNLYAVGESTMGRVGAYAIDAQGSLSYLGGVSSQGNGPAFLSVDPSGAWVLVANYGDGAIAVLPIQSDGTLGAPTDTRVAGMNAHMMIADATDKFVFVPCLGSDYVAQFLFDAKTGKLSPNTPPTFKTAAGAGPRHLAFHPNGAFAYLINETASTITTLSFSSSTGLLTELETQTTLPASYAGPKNTGAEVRVHPSGKFVYASNRGDDSIAIFSVDASTGKLTPTTHPKTGGMTPRSFSLDPSGTHLYAANQGSNTITSFSINVADGSLTLIGSPISQTMASFVGVAQLP